MGKALLVMVAVVLLVYAFFDLVATPRDRVRLLPKLLWFPVIVLLPFVGPLLWILSGLGARPEPPRPPGGSYGYPGGRPPAKGPDDDPDFLRGL
ncbi:MAG: PLD nuclease N-terminal domain-containing protein [Aeromicrobium erythreum]